jgi:pantetheine-phosphate adenylyltransferase
LPIAVVPGSFDPVTSGHLDVMTRTAALFDEVVVAVLVNESKRTLFTIDERIDMIKKSTAGSTNLEVASFSGLLVDFCAQRGAAVVVKGLRGAADLDLELEMAQMNTHLTGVETLLLPTRPSLSFVSSSLVKEVARLGGDVNGLVPADVLDRLEARLSTGPNEVRT